MTDQLQTPPGESLSFVIQGEPSCEITVTENADGTLQFDLTVLDEDGTIGDLGGLFFDFLEPSLLDGLEATGEDVTGQAFAANGVTNLGKGANVKGETGQDPYDCGVRFGTPGKGADDLQETSFTLSHSEYPLSLEDIEEMDFAVRLTSVGTYDGARTASLKLDGQSPALPEGPNDDDQDTSGVDTDLPDVLEASAAVPAADQASTGNPLDQLSSDLLPTDAGPDALEEEPAFDADPDEAVYVF